MNKLKLFFVVATLVCLAVIILTPKQQPEKKPSTPIQQTAASRPQGKLPTAEEAAATIKIKAAWLKDVHDLAMRSNNERAKEIYQFLSDCLRACKAVEHNGRAAAQIMEVPQEGQPWFGFVVVSKAQEKSPSWNKVLPHNLLATYDDVIRILAVRETQDYSPAYRALVCMHEGFHALSTLQRESQGLAGPQPELLKAAEEADAYILESAIARDAGGEPYQIVLTDVYRFVSKNTVFQGESFTSPGQPEYDGRLDAIFGPAQSEQERKLRMAILTIDAMFRLLDSRFENTVAIRMKVNFMQMLYGPH